MERWSAPLGNEREVMRTLESRVGTKVEARPPLILWPVEDIALFTIRAGGGVGGGGCQDGKTVFTCCHKKQNNAETMGLEFGEVVLGRRKAGR